MLSFSDLTRFIAQAYTAKAVRSMLWQWGYGWTDAPITGEPAEYVAAAALARLQVGA